MGVYAYVVYTRSGIGGRLEVVKGETEREGARQRARERDIDRERTENERERFCRGRKRESERENESMRERERTPGVRSQLEIRLPSSRLVVKTVNVYNIIASHMLYIYTSRHECVVQTTDQGTSMVYRDEPLHKRTQISRAVDVYMCVCTRSYGKSVG